MIDRILVVDLETTGHTPPEGDVIEYGWVKLQAMSRDLAGQPFDWEVHGEPESVIVKPNCPILPEASAIHHLVDEDVASGDMPTSALWRMFDLSYLSPPGSAAIAAFGVETEKNLLSAFAPPGVEWLCVYKAALRRWRDAPRHSNQCLRYWRNPIGMDRALASPAHRAGPDAYVTAFLLRDLLNNGVTIEQMIQWTSEPALLARCYIGEYRREGKGTPWSEVEEGYLEWILTKDFKEDVVHTVKVELERREKEREKEMEQRELTYVDDV